MHLTPPADVPLDAAAALTRDLPRDQALGLRLIALARAAAGLHLGLEAIGPRGAIEELSKQSTTDRAQLLRSQAGWLVQAQAPESSPSFGSADE